MGGGVGAGMDEDEAWAVVARERRALAGLLERLTPEQWATPSLCAAWSVREVAAHMMVGPDGSMREFLVTMVRARGDFDRANDVLARRRATRPTAELASDLRTHAENRFTPPTFDWHAPLTDQRLHTLDICLPLGLDPALPPGPWAGVLGFLVTGRAARGFTRGGRPSLTCVATDVDWSHSVGDAAGIEVVDARGPAYALALALSGRRAGLAALDGPGVEALRRWIER